MHSGFVSSPLKSFVLHAPTRTMAKRALVSVDGFETFVTGSVLDDKMVAVFASHIRILRNEARNDGLS